MFCSASVTQHLLRGAAAIIICYLFDSCLRMFYKGCSLFLV